MEVEQRHVHVVAVCLIIAIVLSVCSSFQIEKVCMKVYDLEYQLTGYNCLFKGSGIYTYTASNLVNKITFDRIDSYSYVAIENKGVAKIDIKRGSLSLCRNVLSSKNDIEIVVAGQKCVSIFHFRQRS